MAIKTEVTAQSGKLIRIIRYNPTCNKLKDLDSVTKVMSELNVSYQKAGSILWKRTTSQIEDQVGIEMDDVLAMSG